MELNTLIQGNCLDVLKRYPDNFFHSIVTDSPYGLSFMSNRWDYDVPSVDIWKECFRVLRPGGHLLSFAGTRTQHRMAVNIEDAGFEIKDMIMWGYGEGFPKSHNIGKSVDKLQGNEREVIKKDKTWGKKGITHIMTYGDFEVTKGYSEWEGWGTALKPSFEPITLAKKPVEKGLSIAENCLKWGTGGVNIDECRVETTENLNGGGYSKNFKGSSFLAYGGKMEYKQPQGRFPANFIHDGSDEVVSLFPHTKSSHRPNALNCKSHGKPVTGNILRYNIINDFSALTRPDVEGNASRYFYCAKASQRERNMGIDSLEEKEHDTDTKKKNHHPTVKPIKLMAYLVRLVTPKNGIVLDPFVGSGSTILGALSNVGKNYQYVGIDLDPEYLEIANLRINHLKNSLK